MYWTEYSRSDATEYVKLSFARSGAFQYKLFGEELLRAFTYASVCLQEKALNMKLFSFEAFI